MGTGSTSGNLKKVRFTIIDQDDYKLIATVSDVLRPVGQRHLRITSQLLSAKNPEEEQVKFECMLDDNALANFKKLFEAL